MLKLFCVVVGEGRPFSIKIAEDETVDDLKKKIKEEKMYQFPADELQLYMALKGLSRDEAEVTTLNEDEKVPGCIKMDELLQIQNDHHFGMNFQPKEGKIYVLVVVPREMPAIGKRSNEELGDLFDERLNKFFKDRDEKKVCVFVVGHEFGEEASNPQKDGLGPQRYPWIVGQEEQRAKYMAYLETHLMSQLDEEVFSLVDIANDKSVLDTEDARLPFRINGTADVLLSKSKNTDVVPMAGLCIVIELKKQVEKKHTHQAIGQLMCASIKAPLGCYPMSLLTDLNGTWHFCYFSDKNVLTQAAIVDQPERAIFPLSYFPVPFKKMRVDDFLLRPVDGHAAELMENYELMADELEPEFLMARRMEFDHDVEVQGEAGAEVVNQDKAVDEATCEAVDETSRFDHDVEVQGEAGAEVVNQDKA
ncbi:Crinkler (CRN) family protein, partial [Thraustotheca clavata]